MRYFIFCVFFAFVYSARYTELNTNQVLLTTDYLVFESAIAPYFAVVQNDANFCVYKGTGPSNNQGGVWCSMVTAAGGDYFAVVQSDGNFCVYKGTGHDNNQGGIWCTMVLINLPNVINTKALLTDCGVLNTYEITSSVTQLLWSSPIDTSIGGCHKYIFNFGDNNYIHLDDDNMIRTTSTPSKWTIYTTSQGYQFTTYNNYLSPQGPWFLSGVYDSGYKGGSTFNAYGSNSALWTLTDVGNNMFYLRNKWIDSQSIGYTYLFVHDRNTIAFYYGATVTDRAKWIFRNY